MKLLIISLLLLAIHCSVSLAQIINDQPLSERITWYSIDATLDPDEKKVYGSMDAYWINNSDDVVPDVQMHLYMNAFRSNKTTFLRRPGSSTLRWQQGEGCIDIKSFSDRQGKDLLGNVQYIRPDDGNVYDSTVIRVMLPDPVSPGDTFRVKISFETRLPLISWRTGYNDDFFFVAQWFPKFGVYESEGMRYAVKGAWNCHQFHKESEFYSNHSLYEVSITLPAEYVAGSCGMLMGETLNGEGTKTISYRAEDIVDFAWTAWPGYAVYKDTWKHVNITLLIPPERSNQAERQFRAVKYALEYFDENAGPYPWPYLTIADPPLKGIGAGGMEYTTLFTTISSYLMPAFILTPEQVTVHEFGHAYFMGIIASNEFEEPWLDEGINSFWEQRIMDHYYGPGYGFINHPLLKIPGKAQSRISYVNSPLRQIVSNAEYSWNYPQKTYAMMSYQKASVIMQTLMGIVGEETINEIFREYYRLWAFRHPSGRDFINVVNDVVSRIHGNTFGTDMNWFFDQTIYGTGICDYQVTGITNSKNPHPGDITVLPDSSGSDVSVHGPMYTSTAHIHRAGSVIMPVDVLIHFSDGSEITEKWDGKDRYRDFTYSGNSKIERVKVDPGLKLRMDVNFVNNSKAIDRNKVPVKRLISKLNTFIQFYLSFILL